jgi:hypothetical protein
MDISNVAEKVENLQIQSLKRAGIVDVKLNLDTKQMC